MAEREREFSLRIIAADKVFYNGPAVSVTVTAPDGKYGILAGHSNMAAAVTPGILSYRTKDGETFHAAVSDGVIKVSGGDVLILVESAESPDDIDVIRARRSAQDAEEELKRSNSSLEFRSASAKLSRAMTRIKVYSEYNHKH
ncbi:MAG: ATP synthase F1 subunit epsilon [Firmicutes bacterium]|nr:ATP synthase F1 subunit epsilon [Bacillota bacterium]